MRRRPKNLNGYISRPNMRAVAAFNKKLDEYKKRTGDKIAVLYESPFTHFTMSELTLDDGVLSYEYDGRLTSEMVVLFDDEENTFFEVKHNGIEDTLSYLNECLSRAIWYSQMTPEQFNLVEQGVMKDRFEEHFKEEKE